MASRPIFLANPGSGPLVSEAAVNFTWYAGFSIQQKRKSIAALHQAAQQQGIAPMLEISTKSETELGRKLSAFALTLAMTTGQRVSVEAAFQGSKVFTHGGPYHEFYAMAGRDIKADTRLRNSGPLVAFDLLGERWPLEPMTVFYDWLYLNALQQNVELAEQLVSFMAFSDIEFNPERSINCQARSAALFVTLCQRGLFEKAISHPATFIELAKSENAQAKAFQPPLI